MAASADGDSFYFVLPSNTSPERFPDNKASNYSTPVDGGKHLVGDA